MKGRSGIGVALLAAIALSSCKPGLQDRDFVGVWEGELEIPATKPSATGDTAGDKFAEGMAKMAEGLVQAFGRAKLELREDKTFDMLLVIVPIEGTWSREGSTVRLTPQKVMGLTQAEGLKLANDDSKKQRSLSDMGEPMTLTFSPETRTLTLRDPKEKDSSFVFKRKTEEATP